MRALFRSCITIIAIFTVTHRGGRCRRPAAVVPPRASTKSHGGDPGSEGHERPLEPIEPRPSSELRGGARVLHPAALRHPRDDVVVGLRVDVSDAALAHDCPRQDDAVSRVRRQVIQKSTLEFFRDVFPHFETQDEVEDGKLLPKGLGHVEFESGRASSRRVVVRRGSEPGSRVELFGVPAASCTKIADRRLDAFVMMVALKYSTRLLARCSSMPA